MASTVCMSPATVTGVTDVKPSSLRSTTSKRSMSFLSFFSNPNCKFISTHISPASSSSATRSTHQVHASTPSGAASGELDSSYSGLVGANDLLIVGPGVLGRLVAEKWREEHPGCQITGETVTTDHHEELIKMGFNPTLKGVKRHHKFPFVIFCAPPSRTLDYPSDVREAASLWNGEGSFLFTSSSAPYDCNDNGECYEDSPAVPIGRSPRTDVLLEAENIVADAGGCIVRLAGLYKADRGVHLYYLQQGTMEARPDHILNLIHYEDAASLSVSILRRKLRSRVFLGCDNHPLSRQEVMDLVAKSGKFDQKFVGFTGTNGSLGKKLNNSRTREEIGWMPKHASFAQFLGVPK